MILYLSVIEFEFYITIVTNLRILVMGWFSPYIRLIWFDNWLDMDNWSM